MAEINYSLTRPAEGVLTEFNDYLLHVEYTVAPLIPATYDDPEEGGEITDITVEHDGKPFELTAKETAALEQHIYETHDYSDHGFDGCDGRGWD